LVVGGEAAELVPGQLGGLCVVRGGLFFGRVAGQWPQFQQRARGLGAVQAAVADDRAVVGALGAAVVRVQVLDELRAGGACCPTLKIAMKAALGVPMWGCVKAPQPGRLRGLDGDGAGSCG